MRFCHRGDDVIVVVVVLGVKVQSDVINSIHMINYLGTLSEFVWKKRCEQLLNCDVLFY